MSAGSAQLLEEDWSRGGGSSHTQSALPSAPTESVGYLGRSKFEFQRPGRRACARGGRGRAGCACPAHKLCHVTRPRSDWSGAASTALSSAWLETHLLLNCLGRAPCHPARTHARSSGSFPGSVSCRRPVFFLCGPYEPGPALWPLGLILPPEEGLDCQLDLLRDHSGGFPHYQPVTSSLFWGKRDDSNRRCNEFVHRPFSFKSQSNPKPAVRTLERKDNRKVHI